MKTADKISKEIELKREISILCDKIIEEKKWRPFKDLDIDVTNKGVPFGAYISLIDRKIHIQVDNNIHENVEAVLKNNKIAIRKDNAIDAVVNHLLVHEYNHHHYCPHSIFLFEEIINGIKEVVEKKEITESKIKNICFEIHNMFSDTVINAISSHEEENGLESAKYRLGQGLADLLVLDKNYKENKTIFDFIVPLKLDKAMLLFLKSNMYLCDINPDIHEKIKKYLPKFDDSESVVKKLVELFVQDYKIAERIMDRNILEYDSEKIREYMCDYRQWRSKATKYAEIIYPYLKQEHDWLKNGFTGKDKQYEQQKQDSQGQESSSESNGDKEQNSEEGNSSSGGSGNKDEKEQQGESAGGSEKKENDKKLEVAIKEAQKEDKKEGNSSSNRSSQKQKGIGVGNGSYHVKEYSFEDLDLYYTQAAGNLNLIAEGHKGVENFEIWKGKQSLDEIDLKTIDWSSTIYFKKKGIPHLELYEKKIPLEIDAKVHENLGGLPDLCFVFDSSGSMDFCPKVGGEYHKAVLAFYSILNNLQKRGIAPILKYNAVNFSDTTFSSGWQHYRDISKVKETLFKYQGGGTTIDVKKIRNIRENRIDNYLLFFLSDLGISNLGAITKELVSTHNARAANLLIFKLGGKDLASLPFENAGIPLFYARNADDFMHDSIKITDKIYSGG